MSTHDNPMLGLQSHMNISNMVMTPLQIQQMQQLRQHQQQADMMYLQQHQQQAVVQQQQQQQQQQSYMHTHISSNGAQVNTHMATAAGMMSMAAPAMPVAAMAAPMMFPTLTSTDFASVAAATAVPNVNHQHPHNPPMQMSRGPYIRVSDDTRAQILYLHNQTPSPSSASIARILKGQGLTVPDRTIRGIIQQSIKRFAEQQSRQVERQQRDSYISMQHQPQQQQQSYQMQQSQQAQMLANKNRKRGRPAKVPSGVSSPPTTAMNGDLMESDIKRARTTDAAVSAPGSLAHSTASGGSSSSLVSTTAPSASAPYVFQLSFSWKVRGVEESMISQIASMESDNYPADEACSLENFNYRLTHAAPFFKAAVSVPTFKHLQKDEATATSTTTTTAATTTASTTPSSTSTPTPASTSAPSSSNPPPVLGFVVGTLSASAQLHHESMFNHDPNGRYLCIHSVCVPLALQQQGLGRKLLLEYVRQVKQENAGRLNAILLICKKHMVHFYQSCGFKLVGPSNVVHGVEPWYECRMDLDNSSQPASNQIPLLAAIDAATNGSEQHSSPATSSQSDMMPPEM